MIDDPWFYVAAVPAILIAGISKGGFGGGLVVMSVPILALAAEPRVAAAVMLPQLLAMDVMGVRAFRKKWDKPQMKLLLPACLAGIAFGTATFHYFSADVIRLIIALIAIGFCLHHWFYRSQEECRQQVAVVPGAFWGAMAGFTSFVAHAGGPPLSVYLLPRRMDKSILVGTMIMFFAAANVVKLGAYGYLGQLQLQNMTTSLVLLPLAFGGVVLGIYLHHRVNERLFYRICYVLLFITGLKLLRDALTGML
ncbi:MAG: sulfite exporter TauE/SafE family protein [Acidobacteriota bacterium]|nr:sulfite exporter TauE/SafE family protein [Acidobacteriota bacterium]